MFVTHTYSNRNFTELHSERDILKGSMISSDNPTITSPDRAVFTWWHERQTMSEGENGRSGEMTLVFTLPAIERFENPAAVFDDAREWSRYVGIVDNDSDAVDSFLRKHDLRPDFGPGDADKWLAMEEIRGSTATPRHVFVGTTVEDRRIADHMGWEYRQPTEVAEKADWSLDGETTTSESIVDRLRGLLPGSS